MPKIKYTQSLERTVELDVSDEELAILRRTDWEPGLKQTDEKFRRWEETMQNAISRALLLIEPPPWDTEHTAPPIEFVQADCYYQGEDGLSHEELFDV